VKRFFITLTFLLLFILTSYAQNIYSLEIIPIDNPKSFQKIISFKEKFQDSLSIRTELFKIIKTLHNEAYISASIDSVLWYGKKATAFIFTGDRHEWSKLHKGNVNELVLEKIGFREKFYRKEFFRYTDYVKLEQKIIRYSENHGYPFASIKLDSIQINKNLIEAVLNYNQGPFITFDSIAIEGPTRTKARFLARHIRIMAGQPFSQEKVENIDRLLKELPYIIKTRDPVIVFSKKKAKLILFIEDRKSNQIDGIVGFLPNASNNNKMLITGELNLNLKNLFGTGKNIQVAWKKFNQLSQTLDMSYIHPKLLGSNLDVAANFNLLKQDSTFINVNRMLTFTQNISKRGKLSFYAGLKTSRQLITPSFIDSSQVPPYASFDYHTYGMGYSWNNLNDFFYPRKGWSVNMQGFIGNKSIKTTSTLNEGLYKDLHVRSIQYTFNIGVEKFFKLSKKGVLLGRIKGASIFNNNNIFLSDLYRVGGLNSLRGFNENNFFASNYGIGTVEYRFFTDETSYLLLFFDQGYIYNPLDIQHRQDLPFGFGAGISFATGAGVFNFVYSLGSSATQKLNFNLSKIHFGLVSRF
jgi:translocation and assembly module TamA